MPTEETLPATYTGLIRVMKERLGVEPARMKRLNNRHLTTERKRELVEESVRTGKVHPELNVMAAGLMSDPRVQID